MTEYFNIEVDLSHVSEKNAVIPSDSMVQNNASWSR